jgi:hypothetical protein
VLSCDEVAPAQKDDMEEDEAAAQAESNSQADTGDVRMTEPSAVPLKEKLKAKLLTKSVPINKKKSPTIPLPTLKDFHFLILEEMATVPTDLWQLRMLSKTHVMSLKVQCQPKAWRHTTCASELSHLQT